MNENESLGGSGRECSRLCRFVRSANGYCGAQDITLCVCIRLGISVTAELAEFTAGATQHRVRDIGARAN